MTPSKKDIPEYGGGVKWRKAVGSKYCIETISNPDNVEGGRCTKQGERKGGGKSSCEVDGEASSGEPEGERLSGDEDSPSSRGNLKRNINEKEKGLRPRVLSMSNRG